MMLKFLFPPMIALMLFFSLTGQARAEETDIAKSIHQLIGEDYLYAIDFLFFTKLAAGELRLSETDQPNVYRAELVGRTLGVASWLSGNRTQTYTSLMELTPDGSLRSIEHVSKIHKRKWGKWQNRDKRQIFDYTQGTVFEEKTKNGVVWPKHEYAIPEGQQPVDMLTAFYNLRIGVYGPLVRGSKLLIPTYAKEKFPEIEVNVLTVQQQTEYGYFSSDGLLVKAKIDPEIFGTDSGTLLFWFDDTGTPSRGIVEDVIGMGDVKGYLEKNL